MEESHFGVFFSVSEKGEIGKVVSGGTSLVVTEVGRSEEPPAISPTSHAVSTTTVATAVTLRRIRSARCELVSARRSLFFKTSIIFFFCTNNIVCQEKSLKKERSNGINISA